MLDGNRKPDDNGYKSPMRKLVKFFENSRDSWKTKCQEAKYKVKILKPSRKPVRQEK